jgi:hypothetical protein
MGDIGFKIDVDDKQLAKKIRRQIKRGIRSSVGDLNRGMERTATSKIRSEDAIWRHHLIEGFENARLEFGDRTVASVMNVSDHAAAQEQGVSGTARKRNTPYSYKNKRPPLDELIPWVRDNLTGTGFIPPGYDDDEWRFSGGVGSGGDGDDGGDSGSGGVTQEVDHGHDPLMGAEYLNPGTEVTFNRPDWGVDSGIINQVLSESREWDYEISLDSGFLGVNAEHITYWPNKGAETQVQSLDVGTVVYVGDADSFGKITSLATDLDDSIAGAQIEFRDGTVDLLDLHQFEIAEVNPFDDGGDIVLDGNGLYVPDAGYKSFDISSEVFATETFPEQRVVVYDTIDKEYVRGTVLEYPDRDDEQVKIELDNGLTTTVSVHNAGNFRLAGGEDWDELSEDEAKQRLEAYFDRVIATSHSEWLNKAPSGMTFEELDSARIDWIRDRWLSDVWDIYDDKWLVKEQVRNWLAVVGYPDSEVSKGWSGGIGPLNDSSRFLGVFLSSDQISNIYSGSEDDYVDTLLHESAHTLSHTMGFGYVGRKAYYSDILKYAEFEPDGRQTVTRSGSDLPSDAKLQMFHEHGSSAGTPVGGTDWMKDAYDAALSGETGIKGYSPTFENGTDAEITRLHEAANHAYWLQLIAAREQYKEYGNVPTKDALFIRSTYSITNAEETLATLTEVLTAPGTDYEDRIPHLHELYPWLIEAWLGVHNPPERIAEILRDLGYNV